MSWIITILASTVFANLMQLFIAIFGSAAFITYWSQKRNEKKTAATLIINQIDEAERFINDLKDPRNMDNEALYRSPDIIAENYWDKYKVLFIRKLKNSDIEVIENYYFNICQIQKGKETVLDSLNYFWKWHSLVYSIFQKEMSDLKAKGRDDQLSQKEQAKDIFCDEHKSLFRSEIGIATLQLGLTDFRSIKGTTAYKALEKMSYRNI